MATLVVKQGATCSIEIPNVVDAAGAPLNPAGCTVRAQVRPTVESSVLLHEWSTAAGNVEVLTGLVRLKIPAATSTAWTWFDGEFDVELTDGASQVARISEGHIKMSREVTR